MLMFLWQVLNVKNVVTIEQLKSKLLVPVL